MRIGDVLYFSLRFRFSNLDTGDAGNLTGALRDQLMGFSLVVCDLAILPVLS